jgi:hypothetical protein
MTLYAFEEFLGPTTVDRRCQESQQSVFKRKMPV